MHKPCSFCRGTGAHPAVPIQANQSITVCPVCHGTCIALPHGYIAHQKMVNAANDLKHAINLGQGATLTLENLALLKTLKKLTRRTIFLLHQRGVNPAYIAEQLDVAETWVKDCIQKVTEDIDKDNSAD